jgi:hypothetical protein
MHVLRIVFCLLAVVLSFPAAATFHTFDFQQFYSNADGTIQFIVLKEMENSNGENQLAGRTLTVTQGGTTHALIFDHNLPSNTANRFFLVATQGFVNLGIVTPDYIIPAGFLFIGGGSANYAGAHPSLAYPVLPTDGVNALDANGTVVQNVARNFAGASGSVTTLPPPTTVAAIEYYHQLLDHYFMTALQSDIDALDGGVFAGWARTGETIKAYPTQVAGTVPVCRFFIPPEHGSSHFFSAKAADCAFLLMAAANPAQFPSFSGYIQEEAAAFYITLPDATGLCPMGTVPVFRLWNQRFDSNHRYTTKQTIVTQMQARNFVIEGDAPNFAAMCGAP